MDISSDKYIFRFRNADDNALSELTDNVIWHSKIGNLNDPFEMYFNLDVDALKNLNKSDVAKIINGTRFLHENRRDVERLFFINELDLIYKHIYDCWGVDHSRELLSALHMNTFVACFTKVYDSRLMWGYYGNGMKGICFVYNKYRLEESGIELADVGYVDEMPKINIYKHLVELLRGIPLTLDIDFFRVKHRDWEREKEVRSLHFMEGVQQEGLLLPLKGACIDAVIIGERLVGRNRDFIENYANENDIKVLVAKADFTNYKIQIGE